VIEPTDEMVQLALDVFLATPTDSIAQIDAGMRDALAAVLAIGERDQAAELAELRALFQLQWTRSREADARWRAEDPEARANVWPDLGVLLKWLMDDADQARAALGVVERDRRAECGASGPDGHWCERMPHPATELHGYVGDGELVRW